MPKPSQARSRSSKRGCITCCIHGVKCDEKQPSCLRCSQSGRPCGGYIYTSSQLLQRTLAVRSQRQIGPVGRAPNTLPAHAAVDMPYYDYFRRYTISQTSQLFATDLWARMLPVAAESEPSMWNVVVALGAMHRGCESRMRNPADEKLHRNYAVRHYLHGISEARKLRDPKLFLIASAAFATIAGLVGRFQDRHIHLTSGLKLLREERARTGKYLLHEDLEMVADGLERLQVQDLILADMAAPDHLIHDDNGLAQLPSLSSSDDITLPAKFLMKLTRRFLSMRTACLKGRIPEATFLEMREQISVDLSTWEKEMIELLHSEPVVTSAKGKPQQATRESQMCTIKVYHALLLVFLRGPAVFEPSSHGSLVYSAETNWDSSLPLFERIVALVSSFQTQKSDAGFSMSLEPGLGMPLYVVAQRCRHPVVRRHALRMLRKLDSQEGVWKSSAARIIMEQWITLEEHKLDLDLPLYPESSMLPGVMEVADEKPESWLGRDTKADFPCLSTWKEWPMVAEQGRILTRRMLASLDDNAVDVWFYKRNEVAPGLEMRHRALLRF